MLVIQIINLKLADVTFSQKHPGKEPVPVPPTKENHLRSSNQTSMTLLQHATFEMMENLKSTTLVVEKISG